MVQELDFGKDRGWEGIGVEISTETEREIERRAMKQGLVSTLAKEPQQQGCGR